MQSIVAIGSNPKPFVQQTISYLARSKFESDFPSLPEPYGFAEFSSASSLLPCEYPVHFGNMWASSAMNKARIAQYGN